MNLEEQPFPAGLRVLVVDDDTTCLKLTQNLLLKCKYRVTLTTKSREALRMLKENRHSFDVMLCDVEMPDMDGIKLLQFVSKDIKIPVVMLSSFSDTNRVMQGIKYGAVDYLVKPVRIQELQNIWQHVVRRNKSLTLKKPLLVQTCGKAAFHNERYRVTGKETDDRNEDEEMEDSSNEDDDSTSQKKPRLFWSVELHQKFVDAIEILGVQKAYPKKILDLMNVPGLTREKVASHLQKYRLYLQKSHTGMNHPSDMISAIDEAQIGPLGGGYGVFRSLAGQAVPGLNSTIAHSQAMLARLNTAPGLTIQGLSSSPMLQSAQLSNSKTPFTSFRNVEPATTPSLQGYQTNKASLSFQPNSSFVMNQLPPQRMSRFGNQPSFVSPSSNVGALRGAGSSASNVMNPNWGASTQSSIHPLSLQNNLFPSIVSNDGISPPTANIQDDPLDFFRKITSLEDLSDNFHTQDCLNGGGSNSSNKTARGWQCLNDSYSLISTAAPTDHNLGHSSNQKSIPPFGQLAGVSSQLLQQNEEQLPDVESSPTRNFDDFLLDDPKLLASSHKMSEYLEDIVGALVKPVMSNN